MFAIPLNFEVLIAQQDIVTQNIALRLDFLIIGLLQKFLDMIKILLAYNH